MTILEQIREDRDEARKQGDTNADFCFLALASADGEASVRTLVLRDIIDNRFRLFINKSSPKWALLNTGASYELLLWYQSQQKQYRVTGTMEELDADIIEVNWQRRPVGSKYLDYLYESHRDQSSKIESRRALTDLVKQIRESHDQDKMTTPGKAVGIELVADRIESLDLSKEDRIHDRRQFLLQDGDWQMQFLVP